MAPAAVLGGTAISGGLGNLAAVAGAALFLTQLGQMLKMLGLSSAFQFVIQGIAIAFGMAVAGVDFQRLLEMVKGARGRGSNVAGRAKGASRDREG